MLHTLLKWCFLFASGGVLLLSLSTRSQHWLDRHGFIPNQYSYGDLYNLTNLRAFKETDFTANSSLSDSDKPRKKYRDVHLYTIGDSFTKIDTAYYAAGHNVHVWIGGSLGVETVLDKTKKNILVIQFIERVLQERLYYPDYETIYIKGGFVEPGRRYNPEQQTAKQDRLTNWIMTRFGHEINQRLEFLLFNNWPFTWFKETKAQLTLTGFGRTPKTTISHDKRHLFYDLEADTAFVLSAFRPIPNQKIDTLVTNLNAIRQHYLRMGFDEVYVCMIPNKVTVQDPTYGLYNHQIERIEAHPQLQTPVLSMIDTLRQHPDWYHLGDGHWNKNGKRFWLRQVNKLVVSCSSEQANTKPE